MSQRLEDYDVIGIIGTGTSGTCYKVRNKFSNELFAWKAVDYGNLTEDNKKLLVSEVNVLRSLYHPNIVKYCGKILHRETTTLYIITEWCEGGDLSAVIRNAREKGTHLEESFIWRILYQVSRAIQVCHSRLQNFTIFHRDIKPANVFLDGQGNAKLGDFGLARIVKPENEFSETIVGTPYYMSPELIKGNKYNRKSDIWALGCLIYELCALTPPFNGSNIIELADTIKTGKYKNIPSHYSDNLKKVISFMLSSKHEFRPTIEMILHHPAVVINIKPHRDLAPSRQSYSSKNLFEDCGVNQTLNSELINLTLVDPELISNKVFKDKWVEKHEALREREALLKRREKCLGEKERSLASRERHLLMLEKQTRQKQYLADLQIFKKKETLARDPSNGHETDASVEPRDTPIRPTSAKLDPARLPRPDILTKACKKLEELERKTNKMKHSGEQQIDENFTQMNISKVRRSLTVNFEKKLELKSRIFPDENGKSEKITKHNKTDEAHCSNKYISSGLKCNKQKEMINLLKDAQKININQEIQPKLSTLKKQSNHKGKSHKENRQSKNGDILKTSHSSMTFSTKKDSAVHFII